MLLYHGPSSEAAELLARYPFFNLVVCAHNGDEPGLTRTIGNTTLVSAGTNGKYIGEVKPVTANSAQKPIVQYTALGPKYKDDTRVQGLHRAYLDRLAAENLIHDVNRRATDSGDAYAGSDACKPCHEKAYQKWRNSNHAHATRTLAARHEDRDPECLVCHTVGFDRESGYDGVRTVPDLGDVGCESCHGAAQGHVKNPANRHMPPVTENACRACHVLEHSPSFSHEAYWRKIAH